jgi:diacylglycerol kinase family enzyme
VRHRFLLVANPTAGPRRARLGSRVVAALQARGASVERAPPYAPGTDAVLRAAAEEHDAVIACGGDGTVRALAAALGPADVPIGIVPAGTGNVLAHELGLPRDAEALADLLLGGPVAHLEGAEANGEAFFLMAGVGFDGAVMLGLDTSLKRRIGKAAFAWPLLGALTAPAPRLEVEVDGVSHRAVSVIATRARAYAGRFVLVSSAGLRRPGLHVGLLRSESRRARLRQLLALARGDFERDADVTILTGRRVIVRAAAPVPVQLDGDPAGATPLDVRAGGPHLNLIVPPAFLQRGAD